MPAGRIKKYPEPRKLELAIKRYFDQTDIERITQSGLCLSIGLTRATLYDYLALPDYEYIVAMARLRIENAYETALRETGGAANIFAMKQFGWTDKHEIEHSGSQDRPLVTRVVREIVPMRTVEQLHSKITGAATEIEEFDDFEL